MTFHKFKLQSQSKRPAQDESDDEQFGNTKLLDYDQNAHSSGDETPPPTSSKRVFAAKPKSTKSGPGTLPDNPPQFQRSVVPAQPNMNTSKNVVAYVRNLPPDYDVEDLRGLGLDQYKSLTISGIARLPDPHENDYPFARPASSALIHYKDGGNAQELEELSKKFNKKLYLGCGYYMYLDRYRNQIEPTTEQLKMPFGAHFPEDLLPTYSKAAYAPPAELRSTSKPVATNPSNHQDLAHSKPQSSSSHVKLLSALNLDNKSLIVIVRLPPNQDALRACHGYIELILRYGAEGEAALRASPHGQYSEELAFIWDDKHPLNQYCKWKLHKLMYPDSPPNPELFEGVIFMDPKPLRDEFATSLRDLDPGEVETFDDSDGQVEWPKDEQYPNFSYDHGGLSVRGKEKLLYMLTHNVPCREFVNVEIAQFANFVSDRNGVGMEDIVSILIANIRHPYALEVAYSKPNLNQDEKSRILKQTTLNSLYILSDVAMVCRAEAKKLYKYQAYIGEQLKKSGVFRYLSQVPKLYSFTFASSKYWYEEVREVLAVWREEKLFDAELMDHLERSFNDGNGKKGSK